MAASAEDNEIGGETSSSGTMDDGREKQMDGNLTREERKESKLMKSAFSPSSLNPSQCKWLSCHRNRLANVEERCHPAVGEM